MRSTAEARVAAAPARRSARPGAVDLVVAAGAASCSVVVVLPVLLGQAVTAGVLGRGPTARLVLALMVVGFLVLALVTTTTVTTGAVAAWCDEAAPVIALRRLLGASAAQERRRAAVETTRRTVPATALGALVGYLLALLAAASLLSGEGGLAVDASALPSTALVLLPLAAQAWCVRRAAHRGTVAVLEVRPADALRAAATTQPTPVPGGAASTTAAAGAAPPVRRRGLLLSGTALLLAGAATGALTPAAAMPAALGGALLCLALLAGADRVTAAVVRRCARVVDAVPALLGRSRPEVDLAARVLLRHPRRTSRAVMALVLPTATVVMLATATATAQGELLGYYAGTPLAGPAGDTLAVVVTVATALTALTALTAATGMAVTVASGTRLRRREIALARVLGQPVRAAGRQVLAESALTAGAAAVIGVGAGAVLGWAAAQSLLASVVGHPLLVPVVPAALVAALVAALAATALACSVRPARRALQGPPVRALLET